MNTATNTPNGSSETPHHRRSREEVESLAKSFVGSPSEDLAPVKPRARIAMIGGGAVALIAVLALVFWPKGRSDAEKAQAESARAAKAAEAEAYLQRFEAERERKRQEMASSQEYLDRMAAADAALLKDIGEQASRLAERVAALPAPSDAPPTPRAESRFTPAKPAPTPTQTAPAPTQQAPTQTASAAPAKPAPAPATTQAAPAEAAPAQAAPTEVAQADKASCSIHVSELTKSGKLTYADVKKMKGGRFDEATGSAFTPPIQAAGGRSMIFEVLPNGCVIVRRG